MAVHNRMIRPRNRASVSRIRMEASKEEATLWLYDVINDWYGIHAGDFAREVAGLAVGTIHLRINSPGGDVFGARAIIAALRASGARVIAHIDGLAASAATFIAVNCDEVRMADGGFFMIHQASAPVWGNAGELRDAAEVLDKIDATIVNDYARRTGAEAQQIRDWMAAETWFTAEEAKTAGFVDAIVTGQAVDNSGWDFSGCRNAPAALSAARPESEPEPAPLPVATAGQPARDQARRVLAMVQLNG
ncbi:hypothetical protein QR66_04755 [Chromobacterium piscinae]|nr:hypothetical protein QR66_04755 [Chromobacterium piscinae]